MLEVIATQSIAAARTIRIEVKGCMVNLPGDTSARGELRGPIVVVPLSGDFSACSQSPRTSGSTSRRGRFWDASAALVHTMMGIHLSQIVLDWVQSVEQPKSSFEKRSCKNSPL